MLNSYLSALVKVHTQKPQESETKSHSCLCLLYTIHTRSDIVYTAIAWTQWRNEWFLYKNKLIIIIFTLIWFCVLLSGVVWDYSHVRVASRTDLKCAFVFVSVTYRTRTCVFVLSSKKSCKKKEKPQNYLNEALHNFIR